MSATVDLADIDQVCNWCADTSAYQVSYHGPDGTAEIIEALCVRHTRAVRRDPARWDAAYVTVTQIV